MQKPTVAEYEDNGQVNSVLMYEASNWNPLIPEFGNCKGHQFDSSCLISTMDNEPQRHEQLLAQLLMQEGTNGTGWPPDERQINTTARVEGMGTGTQRPAVSATALACK